MKTTEIRLIPKTEPSRDLVYCERTSCDRSLRILCQDSSIEQYKFLLRAYREIISTYLSVRNLVSPVSFFNSLIRRLEVICQEEGLILSDLHGMGLHLVLQEQETFYILTTAENRIHIGREGIYKSLAGSDLDGVERLDSLKLHSREELFPQRLQDIFSASRLQLEPGGVATCLLGCSEREVGSLQAALQDIGPPDEYEGEVSLAQLDQKAVFLRLDAAHSPGTGAKLKKRDEHVASAPFGKVHSAMIIAITVIVVVVGAVWIAGRQGSSSRKALPEHDRRDLQKAATSTAPSAGRKLPIDEAIPTDEAAPGPTPPVAPMPARFEMKLGWKNDYPQPVTSSPAVNGGDVFFGCRDGYLYALKRESGELVWKYKAAGGIGASPAILDGRVIGADYSGSVFSLDIETGLPRWRRKLPAKIVSSPCPSEKNIFVGCFDGLGYCLSRDTGEIMWRRKTGGRLWGTAVYADGRFVFPSHDGGLYALEAGTGEVAWVYKMGGSLDSSPVVTGNMVVLGAPDGRVHAVDVRSGEAQWVFVTGGPIRSTLAAHSGRVYVGSHDRRLYCLDAATGSLVWKFESAGFIFSRPVVVAGKIFFGSYDRNLYCLDARSGELIDRYSTNGEIYSSPETADGCLMFGNNAGEFICLNYSDEKTL